MQPCGQSRKLIIMISSVKTKVVAKFETSEMMCVEFMQGQKAIIIIIVANESKYM